MGKTLQHWFDEYGQSHQHPTNKMIHLVCVPLIYVSTLALLWKVPLGPLPRMVGPEFGIWLNLATVSLLGVFWFYARLSTAVFAGMFAISAAGIAMCIWIESTQTAPLAVVAALVFLVAWIGQFIGHKIEGKKPSFLKDLQFLLIGPAWVLHFVYKKMGISVAADSSEVAAMK